MIQDIFPAYGFHEQERWRENGFCVAFDPKQKEESRKFMYNIAINAKQKGTVNSNEIFSNSTTWKSSRCQLVVPIDDTPPTGCILFFNCS